jgi:hypothetical protein
MLKTMSKGGVAVNTEVWGPAPPESRVADKLDNTIFKPVSVERTVDGI